MFRVQGFRTQGCRGLGAVYWGFRVGSEVSWKAYGWHDMVDDINPALPIIRNLP